MQDGDSFERASACRNAKRTRVSSACIRCKSAKIKCSDFRPCQKCTDSGKGSICEDQSETKRNKVSFYEDPGRHQQSITGLHTAVMNKHKQSEDYIREACATEGKNTISRSFSHSSEYDAAARISKSTGSPENATVLQCQSNTVKTFHGFHPSCPPQHTFLRAGSLMPPPPFYHREHRFVASQSSSQYMPHQIYNFQRLPPLAGAPPAFLPHPQQTLPSPADFLAVDRLRLLLALAAGGSAPAHAAGGPAPLQQPQPQP